MFDLAHFLKKSWNFKIKLNTLLICLHDNLEIENRKYTKSKNVFFFSNLFLKHENESLLTNIKNTHIKLDKNYFFKNKWQKNVDYFNKFRLRWLKMMKIKFCVWHTGSVQLFMSFICNITWVMVFLKAWCIT